MRREVEIKAAREELSSVLKMAEIVQRLVTADHEMQTSPEEQERLVALKKQLASMQTCVFNTIERISDPLLREILVARYLQRKKWAAVARELHYSEKWIYEKHSPALHAYALVKKGMTVDDRDVS